MCFCGCIYLRLGLLVALCLSSASSLALSPADTNLKPNLAFGLVDVEHYLATDEILTSLPTPAVMSVERIVAFEDHEYFAYVYGTSPAILRRVIYLRLGRS